MVWLLLIALVGILLGEIFALDLVTATGVVTSVVALTAVAGRPLRLMLVFWVWLEAIILALFCGAVDFTVSWFGLPRTAVWMLVGIWLLPLLIWPFGFMATFKDWIERK